MDRPGIGRIFATLLHAAHIARARGKQGIALFPGRKSLEMVGVKFVNPGDEGIAAESIIDAKTLIATLEPHLKALASVKRSGRVAA